MEIEAIGWVRSPRTRPVDDGWGDVVSTITIDESFGPDALAGLEGFSHLEVVYRFHLARQEAVERGARHPRENRSWPAVGIFARRAKSRPNRLGVSVCRLLAVHGRTLTVRGLDAIDGTPVIDLKPYMAELAPRGPVRQPAWTTELMSGYWVEPERAGGTSADTRRSYDAVASEYAARIAGELAMKPLDRALLGVLAELAGREPVLDVGAGLGHVTAHLAGLGARVVALDLSPAMCAAARRSYGVAAVPADMVTLPVAPGSAAAVACLYAVIHLDRDQRRVAYSEMARSLRPGGHALVAFHTADADVEPGGARRFDEWWDEPVALTFRFLDPGDEARALEGAGLRLIGRLDRAPVPGGEHPSDRSYLLARKDD